jgi:hypothetical protein
MTTTTTTTHRLPGPASLCPLVGPPGLLAQYPGSLDQSARPCYSQPPPRSPFAPQPLATAHEPHPPSLSPSTLLPLHAALPDPDLLSRNLLAAPPPPPPPHSLLALPSPLVPAPAVAPPPAPPAERDQEAPATHTATPFTIKPTLAPTALLPVFEALAMNVRLAQQGFSGGKEADCFAYLDRVQTLASSLMAYRVWEGGGFD